MTDVILPPSDRHERDGRFPILYPPEVDQARLAGRPIVALESTIITHGMPFPQNVETAERVEAEIRAHGAVPATIALMDGHIHVGLTAGELRRLARAEGVAKVSRADMAACLAGGGYGATTVTQGCGISISSVEMSKLLSARRWTPPMPPVAKTSIPALTAAIIFADSVGLA